MSTDAAPTAPHGYLILSGFFNHFTGNVQHFDFNTETDTPESAAALVALFPKSAKLTAGRIMQNGGRIGGFIRGSGKLATDGVNGGVNETAIRRYRAVVRAAAKLGIEIRWTARNYSNAYISREAFEAAAGI